MPHILTRTPPWLAKPSAGYDVFAVEGTSNSSKPPRPGPTRTIARRGNEIFVAVGNQLRWADLALLRHQSQHRERQRKRQAEEHDGEAPGKKNEADQAREEPNLAHYRVRHLSWTSNSADI